MRSHLGIYAITTVGIINNAEALVDKYFSDHRHQLMAMSNGSVNTTELVAALINEGDTVVVTSGAWKDTVGVIKAINPSKRSVTIIVEMFGRETPVELSFVEVKKL